MNSSRKRQCLTSPPSTAKRKHSFWFSFSRSSSSREGHRIRIAHWGILIDHMLFEPCPTPPSPVLCIRICVCEREWPVCARACRIAPAPAVPHRRRGCSLVGAAMPSIMSSRIAFLILTLLCNSCQSQATDPGFRITITEKGLNYGGYPAV